MTAQQLLDPARKPLAEGVSRAYEKFRAHFAPTPLLPFDVDGQRIWLKAESLQPIGAFKLRGAWHRLSDIPLAERGRGVVAFSSGNHAQGVAFAARAMGIAATIIMPRDAPATKVEGTLALGAAIIPYDRLTEDRSAMAAAIAAKTGAIIVPSFDDPWIIEGQGSTAIEAQLQLDQAAPGNRFDSIIACCGGGGLASGMALALPGTAITIAEPEGWDDMGISLRAGQIVPVGPNPPPTICDALQTPMVSPLTFSILAECGTIGVAVTEQEVEHAIRTAFDRLHLVIEPGGAVALAAVLAGKVRLGQHPLVTLSGGNVDPVRFAAIITDRKSEA